MKKREKIKTLLKVKNQAEEVAKMYLYGDIGEDIWSDDTITLAKVNNELKSITSNEIEVHINSYGGDVFESIAISNLLKEQGKKIVVVIDGIAASGGSIIAMAGDEIRMFNNSQMMIHNPWTVAMGNAKEFRKVADDLEKMQSSLEESYLKRFNGSREELKKLLDEETFMTADDCFICGLADVVIDKTFEIEDVFNAKTEKVSAKVDTVETPKEEVKENGLLKIFI